MSNNSKTKKQLYGKENNNGQSYDDLEKAILEILKGQSVAYSKELLQKLLYLVEMYSTVTTRS